MVEGIVADTPNADNHRGAARTNSVHRRRRFTIVGHCLKRRARRGPIRTPARAWRPWLARIVLIPGYDASIERKPQLATRLPFTVRGWLQAYREGSQPRDLLAECLRQAHAERPAAAWIHIASEAELVDQVARLEGLSRACTSIDETLRRFPLFGVPFAVKDNIDVAHVATTAACPAYRYVPARSAAAVRRLVDAGAIWIGKTNLDQFATGLVGTRSPYGTPASVFSAHHVSGGSSSGSAVTVASARVAFSLGTDTAGSGRVPAGFNQIVGLKPTPGRVGTSGVVPACRTLDCVSIFALSVEDAAHVLSVIEGADPDDSYSDFAPGPAGWGDAPLRIGIPRDLAVAAGSDYAIAFGRARAHARVLGHTLVPVDFEALHRTASLLYSGPWVAERRHATGDLLERAPQALDATVRTVIGAASRFSAAETFDAQYKLKDLQREAASLWNEVDVLLVPTAPHHPTFDEVAADPIGANSALGVYTNFVNLLGWCAVALPAGNTAKAMPFGVTFIARGNHDAALACFAKTWQESLDLTLGATGQRLAHETQALDPVCMRKPAAEATLPIAVVGAHLSGMPLNGQLRERGARLAEVTTTSACYRLHALAQTFPAKPGLVRSDKEGHAIEVEVWEMPAVHVGSFLALVRTPLGLGAIELADGRWVHGFLCEAHAVASAPDISRFGGWRSYLQSTKENAVSQPHDDSTREQPASPARRQLITGAAGIAAATILGAPAIVRAQSGPKIRIGFWPVAAGLPFFAAIEKGYFKEAGVEVEPIKFAGAQQVMEAMLSGRSDGSSNGTGSANLAIGEIASPGLFKIFATNPSNAKYVLDEFLVPKDSAVKTLADLKGKRVASGPGIQNVTLCKTMLERAGAGVMSVTELPIGQHVAAMAAGQVDAVYTLEPTGTVGRLNGVSRLLEAGVVARYILGDPMAPWHGGAASLTTEFIKKHPAEARKFIAAYARGIELVRTKPEEARQFMKGYTAIEGALTSEVPLASYMLHSEFKASDVAFFQKFYDLFSEKGIFEKRVLVEPMLFKA
jgi:allophanate hydrolase